MIVKKTLEQISKMRDAGRITAEALLAAKEAVAPGVSTKHIDNVIHSYITKHGAKPSFLGYGGFPASACISVNDTVIHGIPSEDIVLKEGDIVSIDVGAFYRGYHGDSARTFAVGKISDQAQKLIDVTEESFWCGFNAIRPDGRIGDIGNAVEERVKQDGFSVVRLYVGHGVGRDLHEDPSVPNYGVAGHGPRLFPGMVIAIEPMVNIGTYKVKTLSDEWTVKTLDGSLSAHYENTVAITENGVEILTKAE